MIEMISPSLFRPGTLKDAGKNTWEEVVLSLLRLEATATVPPWQRIVGRGFAPAHSGFACVQNDRRACATSYAHNKLRADTPGVDASGDGGVTFVSVTHRHRGEGPMPLVNCVPGPGRPENTGGLAGLSFENS